ncbi:MAG: hypothetical protein WDN06_15805 [Asticcacaulis sp.]
MITHAGPRVEDGIFAQYKVIYFDCYNYTMGIFAYTSYNRDGITVDEGSVDAEDIEFKPVEKGTPDDLSYQIVCGQYDPSSLPQFNQVTTAQLIATDITAYDAKAGHPYAY